MTKDNGIEATTTGNREILLSAAALVQQHTFLSMRPIIGWLAIQGPKTGRPRKH